MATNIRSISVGLILIQTGNGVPTHISTIGTIYIDLNTATEYINKDGVSNWVTNGTSGLNLTQDQYNAITGATSPSASNHFVTFQDLIGVTGSTSSFTGGTVSGATNFTGGLTANTISATTYYGLPKDIYVTGVTWTYSSNTLTISDNLGNNINTVIPTFQDLTVNGNLSVLGTISDADWISTNQYVRAGAPGQHIHFPYTTGTTGAFNMFVGDTTSNQVGIQPTYGSTGWVLSLPPNAGSNGQVMSTDGSGNATWVNQNVFTGGTVSGYTYFQQGFGTGYPNANLGYIDFYNGNNSNIIRILSNPSASNYNMYLPASQGSANQVLADDGNGNLFWKSLSDTYSTGLTFNTSTFQLTEALNNGTNLTADLSTLLIDITGGTYNSSTGVATFYNHSGGTVTISGFLTGYTNTYVSGFTYDNNNNLNIYQTQNDPTLRVNISQMSGLTVNGSLSATTISGGTEYINRLLVNASTNNLKNPERLLVNDGGTGGTGYSNTIVGIASVNNYAQLNIQNTYSGNNSSSDVVATADNGNENTGYVDMGINSSQYNQGFVGGANDAYVYSTGNNLYLGNVSTGKTVGIFVGGSNVATTGNTTMLFSTGNTTSYVPFYAPTLSATTYLGLNLNAWSPQGNSGLTSNTYFLGTTDANSLIFKTNNKTSGILDPVGYNVGFGTGSLTGYTSASTYNVGIGYNALPITSGGTYNIALGANALAINTTGSFNIAIGYNALKSFAPTSDGNNIAIGTGALSSWAQTTSNGNTKGAVAIGYNSQSSANSAIANTSVGYNCMAALTGGQLNAGFGRGTMLNYNASYGSAFGAGALGAAAGNYNSAFGNNSGANTTGTGNSFFGYNSGGQNTSGSYNTFIGAPIAGVYTNNVTGSYNTTLGYAADMAYSALTNATSIGYSAQSLTSNSIQLGNPSVTGLTIGNGGLNTTSNSPNLYYNTSTGLVSVSTASSSSVGQIYLNPGQILTMQSFGSGATYQDYWYVLTGATNQGVLMRGFSANTALGNLTYTGTSGNYFEVEYFAVVKPIGANSFYTGLMKNVTNTSPSGNPSINFPSSGGTNGWSANTISGATLLLDSIQNWQAVTTANEGWPVAGKSIVQLNNGDVIQFGYAMVETGTQQATALNLNLTIKQII